MSDVARNDHYRLTIKRIASRSEDSQAASGLVSTYFHDRLAVGDRIEAKAPSGTFTIDVTQHKKLGWTPGQNIDLDYHWPGAQTARVHAVADEIVLSDFKEKH